MRKERILSGLFALALLATAGFGVHKSMKSNVELSDLALANVEALAQNEGGPNIIPCYGTIRMELRDPNVYEPTWTITFCNGCQLATCYEYTDEGNCTTGGFILV